ncbi:MAG: ABC transporter permease subunit [Bacteroidales bacterium]|nr:ABC transporter permease subunit [Bacteroidales bacterium]
MLRHLIIKEIQEIVTNTRSLFVLLICVLLIPLGLYVSTKEYEQNKAAYKDAKQMYEERNIDNKRMEFVAEGYIPPSPLSIFSSGLSGYLPNKITADSRGIWRPENDYGINNPVALLFGKIDFYFIITIILSLLAFMVTFNSITGEKENGTLRLMVANAVPRWKIIFAKIAGSYTVFLVSFLVGVISGLVLLTLTTSVPILSGSYLVPFLVIMIISLLFLFVLFNMGILLSIKTKNSGASITASLLLWVLIAIIIPKVSPMVAQIIYPIETEEVVNKQKNMKRDEIGTEFDKTRGELMKSIMSERGINVETIDFWTIGNDPESQSALRVYDEEIVEVKRKYDEMENNAIGIIEKDYHNQQLFQQNISKNISRISPIGCYTYLISDLTNTGLIELSNIESNARQFASFTESEYYSKMRKYYKEYRFGGSLSKGIFGKVDWGNFKVPTLNTYNYPKLVSSLGANWVDLLLICFYALFFFTVSVFQFIKYDVR